MALFIDISMQNFQKGIPSELQREILAHSIEWGRKEGLYCITSLKPIVAHIFLSGKEILIPI